VIPSRASASARLPAPNNTDAVGQRMHGAIRESCASRHPTHLNRQTMHSSKARRTSPSPPISSHDTLGTCCPSPRGCATTSMARTCMVWRSPAICASSHPKRTAAHQFPRLGTRPRQYSACMQGQPRTATKPALTRFFRTRRAAASQPILGARRMHWPTSAKDSPCVTSMTSSVWSETSQRQSLSQGQAAPCHGRGPNAIPMAKSWVPARLTSKRRASICGGSMAICDGCVALLVVLRNITSLF
jgi:hypothetical protein